MVGAVAVNSQGESLGVMAALRMTDPAKKAP